VAFSSLIRKPAARFLATGLVLAALVASGGYLGERRRFGVSDAQAFARVEGDVRSALTQASASLNTIATALARDGDQVEAAANDRDAAPALFDRVQRATGGSQDLAVTIYSATGVPLAWSGRPSDPPLERIKGPASLFVAPDPLGLRLVRVLPIFDNGGRRRLGAVAAERLLSARRGLANLVGDSFTLPTRLVPVSIVPSYEGAGEGGGRYTFVIRAPGGEALLEARVAPDDLRRAREGWRRGVLGVVLAVFAVTLLLLAAPLLDMRARARRGRGYGPAVAGLVGIVLAAWALVRVALPPGAGAPRLFTGTDLTSRILGVTFRTSSDFLLTGLALLALVAIGVDVLERRRLTRRSHRRSPGTTAAGWLRFGLTQIAAASVVAVLLLGYQYFLVRTLANTRLDVLQFSMNPLSVPRLSLAVGLLFFHAALVWASVLVLRFGTASWRLSRRVQGAARALLWVVPVVALLALAGPVRLPIRAVPLLILFASIAGIAHLLWRGSAWYRHAAQASRLVVAFLALVVPAVAMYPVLYRHGDDAKRHMIEGTFAEQVMFANQKAELLRLRDRSIDQIDALPGMADLVAASTPAQGGVPSIYGAFRIWVQTDLARYRIASAVELYGADGSLVSRFAFSLPEYTRSTQPWWESSCQWTRFDVVSPIGSEERRLAHAGRGICRSEEDLGPRVLSNGQRPAGAEDRRADMVGAIVVHVTLDYETLPFLSSQSPYLEIFRPTAENGSQEEELPSHDVEFMVYGWGRTAVYASGGVVWPLDDEVFRRAYASRAPFWTETWAGDRRYALYYVNDQAGIYVLGYPVVMPIGHLVNLAEIVALAGLAYVALVAAAALFTAVTRRHAASGRALLREIRASFYRKLFLAFVAVSVVPVLTLAFVARAYIAGRLVADVKAAALRTTEMAKRVIEDSPLQAQGGAGFATLDDDLVWISRVVKHDVNIFEASRLLATSERDLFDSGLLPTRTPADVYRAVVLERLPSYVGEERAGDFRYMLASAPVRAGDREAVLTVPLTLRQQEIRREIEDLNRRIVLATVLFILFGAGIGYPIAERIADPVNRLTRATQRIARGELDARIAATSSDELRRLVEAFNSMASELKRKGEQLERTHRLEAWAEMARQVAHEIKNPLTPIQLSAEHLRRVHGDRGQPLSPVLDECVDSILSQVRLLRQIASEFSSFASSPSPRPQPTAVGDLLEEVLGPYRSGLAGKVTIEMDVSPDLPVLTVDRTLVGRAVTNIIENGLHAMPGGGRLTIRAEREQRANGDQVRIAIADTGVGMDEEALARLFEPYFSTKAIGTGLGLTIARRNVEVSGGRIEVRSARGEGTTVTLILPAGQVPSDVA
jgi:signal transduction histidine kinase